MGHQTPLEVITETSRRLAHLADGEIAFAFRAPDSLRLIRPVKPEDFSKPATHPERGTMTFQTIVETMAGHDRNYIRQMEGTAAQVATAS